MREMLDNKLTRFEELEQQLNDPAIMSDSSKVSAVAREHGALSKLANKYRKFKSMNEQIAELREMKSSDDPEERELAGMELPEALSNRETAWEELLEMTIGGEDASRARCVMEIRAGTGGDEAALFARNLYEMYKTHCELKKWKIEILSASPTELGGFKEISLAFEGEGVFRELQYESGGHRVQRGPETETKGRIHTSAATVAVMPEPEDVEIDLKPDDYRIDKFNASGPGGQHVNKTESAVRLTHLPTGVVVECQDGRSQHQNYDHALEVLRSRLYELERDKQRAEQALKRKTLVSTGDRSAKIRTYNFPQGRVTDHRIHYTAHALPAILGGDLGGVIEALHLAEQAELLAAQT